MKFDNEQDEEEYLLKQWSGDKTVVRIFTLAILAHTIYLVLVQILTVGIRGITISGHIIIWGLWIPMTFLVVTLAFTGPFQRNGKLRRITWYISITIASIM